MAKHAATRFWNRVAQTLGSVVASGGLAVVCVTLAPFVTQALGVDRALLALYLVVAMTLAGYLVVIVAHEAGHFVAARLAGWRVPVASIYGLTLWTAPFRLRLGARAFGGAGVLAIPPRDRPWRLGYCAVMLGGALGNFALAAAALAIVAAFTPAPLWLAYLERIAGYSAVIGVLNLLPYVTARGGTTDGHKALRALRGEDLTPFGHETRLFEQIVRRRPPRDWDPAAIADVACDARAGRSSWSGDMMLYALALDRMQPAEARAALARAAAKLGSVDLIRIEQAFLLAYVDRDAAAAGKLLDTVPRRRVRRLSIYWRTLGLIQLLSGERKDAARSFEAARARLRRMPFTTPADLEGIDILMKLETATPNAP